MDINSEHKSLSIEKFGEGQPTLVKLIEKRLVSHDSYIFVFELPESNATLGLGVGHCLILG